MSGGAVALSLRGGSALRVGSARRMVIGSLSGGSAGHSFFVRGWSL